MTVDSPTSRTSVDGPAASHALDVAWQLCLALAAWRRRGVRPRPAEYRLHRDSNGRPELIETGAGDPNAVLRWFAEQGWRIADGWPAVAVDLLNLYWPALSLSAGERLAIGHLGQSIDGRIATRDGNSQRLSCQQNLIHLHRLRALCDAVVIGAVTALTDDPQLTTRLVPGENPVRVVLDPGARLPSTLKVFNDDQALTVVVCGLEFQRLAESRWGKERVVSVPLIRKRLDLPTVLTQMAERGWPVVFVEGGGITVSRFVEASCLDRLQIAIAPILLGAGREGIQLPGASAVSDCVRPVSRVFQMGRDVLWDFDLRAPVPADDQRPPPGGVTQIG